MSVWRAGLRRATLLYTSPNMCRHAAASAINDTVPTSPSGRTVRRSLAMEGHGAKSSFAFGDSEGDIEMLRAVGYPICRSPAGGLRSIATKAREITLPFGMMIV